MQWEEGRAKGGGGGQGVSIDAEKPARHRLHVSNDPLNLVT